MGRSLAISSFVLLALGFVILAYLASLTKDDGLDAMNQQINQLIEQEKYQEAIPIAERAVAVAKRVRGSEQPETVDTLDNLGFLFQKIGDYAKAEPLYREVLRIRQKVLLPEDPTSALSFNNALYQPAAAESLANLALLYKDMCEYSKAEPLYQEALRIQRKVLGAEHPETATTLNNLGELYRDAGEYDKAGPLLQEALRIRQKIFGLDHSDTAESLNNLAVLYKAMGEYDKAEPLLQEALRICRKVFGSESSNTANALNNLAVLCKAMGEHAKAEPLYQEALQIRQKVLGSEHPDTATSLNSLGALYDAMGEYAQAEPLYQEALRIYKKVLGPEHPVTAISLNNLALLEFDLGRIDEATALARQASAAELTVLSKMFSFTSEEQRLAYLDIFRPYGLFPFLKGTETDLATAVLRYKGVVLDSIVEDRLLAEATRRSQERLI